MIHVLGISHKTAKVEIREKLYFSSDEAVLFMKHVLDVADVDGVVVLSTCNRTEIYFQSETLGVHEHIWNEWLLFKKLNITADYYHLIDDACALHLFSVTAGLESIIVGEYQILGQVKDAYRLSTQNDFSAPELSHLFHKAFEAGKKVKNLQSKSQLPVSSALAAVAMMSDFFQEKKNARIIIFGAGLVAANVIDCLVNNGFRNIQLFNRSKERATKLAEKNRIEIGEIDELNTALGSADVLFTTTSAMYPVIVSRNFENIQNRILCFDLGLPRNIDPSVGTLNQVSLFTLDQIKSDYANNGLNMQEIRDLFSILLQDYNDWVSKRNLKPVIHQFQHRFDKILEQRLQYLKHKVSEREYDLIRESGEFLRDKFLSGIIAGFKEHSGNGKDLEFLEKLQKLVEI